MTSPNPPDGAPLTASPPSGSLAGRVLGGRYRLESLVASGGMAQVWRGTDDVLRRQVAVKLLHPHLVADATFVERFRQEAVAAARLAHPGIVAIYDTCSEDGVEAIVMELVVGRTLRERLDDPTPIDPWQAAGLAAQVAEALDAAHRAGLVHRDIKPANVLLSSDGRVKVADFGIAKAVADADLTQPGLMVGTAKYLAPEQVRGEAVDPRTDLYSLGVVLYEMLCGRAPFVADTDAATALARLQRDPLRPRQVRAGIPKTLEVVVCRAMAREPDERYDTAADLRAALLAAGATPSPEADLTSTTVGLAPAHTVMSPLPSASNSALPAPPGAPAAPSFRQTERSWLVPTVVVVLVALALGIAGVLLDRSGAGTFLDDVRDAIGGPIGNDGDPLTIARANAFDPGGTGGENDDLAENVHDGDPGTSWRTEGYNDRDITRLKPGVGIFVTLESPATIEQLELTSPTNDWRAVIYVAESAGTSLADWGDPVATETMPAGTNTIDLDGARGGAVLVWIVDRGDATGRAAAEIQEVRVLGH
ncbi:MAG: protein kinase domain-containing protein [Acidimicrobiales bacterium]